MANIFSNMVNNFGDWAASKIAPYLNDALGMVPGVLAQSRNGNGDSGQNLGMLSFTALRISDDHEIAAEQPFFR